MDFTVNFMIIMQSYITKQIKALEYAHLKPQFAQMDIGNDLKWKTSMSDAWRMRNFEYLRKRRMKKIIARSPFP
jgi:phage pi2 protein 07